MGDYADMIIDGTVCELCGVFFDDGDSPGHPRKCGSCRRGSRPKRSKKRGPSKADRPGDGKVQKPQGREFQCHCLRSFGSEFALNQHKRDKHGEIPSSKE